MQASIVLLRILKMYSLFSKFLFDCDIIAMTDVAFLQSHINGTAVHTSMSV